VTVPTSGDPLCALDDIPDGQAKGFERDGVGETGLFFVVRQGDRVYGYVNVCPHQFTPLDMLPDRFISKLTGNILCATHGAQFRVEDGVCVRGPCPGERLRPVAVTVADGQVFLAGATAAAASR
jgi:nitrite reductase/ring-hydroxylating ferredoxin subunit